MPTMNIAHVNKWWLLLVVNTTIQERMFWPEMGVVSQ